MDNMVYFDYGWHQYGVSPGGKYTIYSRDLSEDEGFTGKETSYHDRLMGWDGDKYAAACKKAGIRLDLFNSLPEQLDAFLTAYFGVRCRVYFVENQRGYNGYDYIRMDFQHEGKL
jgi:hypothetical protein